MPSGSVTATGSPVVFTLTSAPSRTLLSRSPGSSALRQDNRFQNKIGQSGVFCSVDSDGLKFSVRCRRPSASSRAESSGVFPARIAGSSPGVLVRLAPAQITPGSATPAASGCDVSTTKGPVKALVAPALTQRRLHALLPAAVSVSWITSSGLSDSAARNPVAASVRSARAVRSASANATCTRTRRRTGGSSSTWSSTVSASAGSATQSGWPVAGKLNTSRWLSCAASVRLDPGSALVPARTCTSTERAWSAKLATSIRHRSCSPSAVREAFTIAKLSSRVPKARHSRRGLGMRSSTGRWSVSTRVLACCLPSSAASVMAASSSAPGAWHRHWCSKSSTCAQLFTGEPSAWVSVPARMSRVTGGGDW